MDPVVKVAIDGMVESINYSNGFSSSYNKRDLLCTYKVLIKNGYILEPDEIYRYLIEEKEWSIQMATEAKDFAIGVIFGKKYRHADCIFRKDIVKIWESKAGIP